VILFRRVRGRAAGHVILINPLNVRCIEPTSWGGSEINFSDVHAVTSRDNPSVVQQLLEGRLRLCSTPLCDHTTADPYQPLCERCCAGSFVPTREREVGDLVVIGGKHGFE